MTKFLPAHSLLSLLSYGLDDSFERLGVVHGEVGKHLAVETDVFLRELAHELGIGDAVLTASGVDTLDPKSAEVALLGLTVTVCVGETFLVGVLRNRPNILSRQEVATGSLEDLLAARPGGD